LTLVQGGDVVSGTVAVGSIVSNQFNAPVSNGRLDVVATALWGGAINTSESLHLTSSVDGRIDGSIGLFFSGNPRGVGEVHAHLLNVTRQ
jgi:hypothetical protein